MFAGDMSPLFSSDVILFIWESNVNLGINHGFSCINISLVPRKLFEHEAASPNVQISSKGPGKCYCNEITMDDRCSCITYDSNANCDEKAPKLHINSSNATANQHGG